MKVSILGGVVCLSLLLIPARDEMVRGQGERDERPVGPESEIVRIRKLTGLGNKAIVKTPVYQTSVGRGVNRQGDWVMIEVIFDTAPEWIDELSFQFFAMGLTTTKDGKKAYSFYRQTVRHVDVEKGRNHRTTVFLEPNTIKRYGHLVGVVVEITQGGKLVAVEQEAASAQLPENWWRNPTVIDSKAVTAREGYLLDRSQSPFALINIDDYEVVK